MTWALTVACLFGSLLNSLKIKACFYVWIVCNVGWSIVDIMAGAYSRVVLDVVQMAFSVFGIIKWGKCEKNTMETENKKSV